MVLAFAGDSTITSAPRTVALAGLAAAFAAGFSAALADFSAALAGFFGFFLVLVGTDDLVLAPRGPPHPSLELRLGEHPHDRSQGQAQAARKAAWGVAPLFERRDERREAGRGGGRRRPPV